MLALRMYFWDAWSGPPAPSTDTSGASRTSPVRAAELPLVCGPASANATRPAAPTRTWATDKPGTLNC